MGKIGFTAHELNVELFLTEVQTELTPTEDSVRMRCLQYVICHLNKIIQNFSLFIKQSYYIAGYRQNLQVQV